MCGIIGAVSKRDITKVLLEGLKRLEYRGYDSAGIAVIDDKGLLKRVRVKGKVNALADVMQASQFSGMSGIAHTRWATHGKPSEQNAHPHVSHGEIAVVHNGIIENYMALRDFLINEGYVFTSETDTEVAAHLIHHHYQRYDNLVKAVHEASRMLHGAFALGVMHQQRPNELVAVRRGSPLVIGIGIDEALIASDVLALKNFAEAVIFLEEGDIVQVLSGNVTIYDTLFQQVNREPSPIEKDLDTVSKGQYRHFMLKEIHEQSKVFSDILEGRIHNIETLKLSFGSQMKPILSNVSSIHIVACGTSYHAGLVAKYWIESFSPISVGVEIASEYRYRTVNVPENTLFIAISQSGETADTLAAVQKAKASGYLGVLAICNVATSSLVREADSAFLTRAGVEIGVASTKAFTSQLIALFLLSIVLSKKELQADLLNMVMTLPVLCEQVLSLTHDIEKLAHVFVDKKSALFLGRGEFYPIALEGALKLKEISYIHAEAYPAGELKHGPLALVDKDMPVIALAPKNPLHEKLQSNLHEVLARGGELIVFTDETLSSHEGIQHKILLPTMDNHIAPIMYTIPLQLLAYYVAVLKGTDVDQPRNLAKSVTVE